MRAAGVSKPTLYAHFGSKAELVAAVLERRHAARAAELDQLEGGPLAVFDWLADFYVRDGARGCAFVNAAAELAHGGPRRRGRDVRRPHALRGRVSLAARGIPVGAARAGIELSVLAVGWLLGGSVGVGTVAFALAIGPLVHHTLPWLAVDEARTPRAVQSAA